MKKILLIEDDPIMRENTAEILELAGYEVSTSENGKLGVLSANEIKPDLIICDIMMPELDGYGVLHILSKNPLTHSIPFIFLSAKAEKSDFRKGMELGADDYLTKPFEESELLNAVECRLKKINLLQKNQSQGLEKLNQFLNFSSKNTPLRNIHQHLSPHHYQKREIVFQEGQEANCIYFLNKGCVKTYKIHPDGKEYVTDVFHAGDFFGYTSVLQSIPYADSAFCLEESEIYKLPKADFLTLLYQNRDIAAQFIKLLSNQILEREEKLLSLAYDSVKKRVAQALLELSTKNSTLKNKKELEKVKISRENLAAITGTASETVIRCLSDLKNEKLIEVEGRNIILLKPEELKEVY